MISMKKLGLILCTAVLSVGLLAGCGSDKKEAQLTQTAGVLKVGSETTFPPFEFAEENTNKYIGFDVDLSEEVAKRLGLKLEFVSMGFDALIPATQSGNIDMIAAGINATPEREKALAFSEPYFKEGGFITIVRKDNTDIKKMDDLANKRVGVQIGTVPVEMAKAIPDTDVKEMDSNSNIFMALQAGTIDGAIIDQAVAMYYLKQGADKDLKLVGEGTDAPPFVLGFNKSNTALRDKVNEALKAMREDGTYDKIYSKWFAK